MAINDQTSISSHRPPHISPSAHHASPSTSPGSPPLSASLRLLCVVPLIVPSTLSLSRALSTASDGSPARAAWISSLSNALWSHHTGQANQFPSFGSRRLLDQGIIASTSSSPTHIHPFSHHTACCQPCILLSLLLSVCLSGVVVSVCPIVPVPRPRLPGRIGIGLSGRSTADQRNNRDDGCRTLV